MTLAAASLKVLFFLTRSMGAPPQLFLGMVLLSVVYLFFLLTFPKWVAERKQEGPTTRGQWKAVKWVGDVAAPY